MTVGKRLPENADSGGQNTALRGPCFSELKTLTFTVHPVFERDDPSLASAPAMYDTFLSELDATLSLFGVPTTVLQPFHEDWGARQPNEADDSVRSDWFFGIEGREVA